MRHLLRPMSKVQKTGAEVKRLDLARLEAI